MNGHATLGTRMAAEMEEQPAILGAIADRFTDHTAAVRSVLRTPPRGVAFLARGSSDNAALLGRYATEFLTGLPTCLVAPSVITSYGRPPVGFQDWVLVALSQSGATPEIVTVAKRFAAAGSTVIALTNNDASELAGTAALTIPLRAGAEVAVPATKTVTSQMLAALAVAGGLGRDGLTASDARQITAAAAAVLADNVEALEVGQVLSTSNRLAVVGRGFCYPAALETALKIQETTGVMAQGFSAADFLHGPIAVSGPRTPVVLFAGNSPADEDTRALHGLLCQRGATVSLIDVGSHAALAWPALGHMGVCLLATIRGQQIALSLARMRGVDPDQPPGLNKITLTRLRIQPTQLLGAT